MRARLIPLAAAGLLAATAHGLLRSPEPAGADMDSTLGDLLARDHGVVLVPGSVRPAGRAGLAGLPHEAGRQDAYFLARPGADADPDIYRASVRVGSDGRVLDLGTPFDLTRTPYAAESWMTGAGAYALYAVRVMGQVQSVLLVDDRADEREIDADAGATQHAIAAISRYQHSGRRAGVGLRLYTFEDPPERVEATFGESNDGTASLDLQIHGRASGGSGEADVATAHARIDPPTGEILEGGDHLTYEARAWTPELVIHWVVNTVRDVSFIGPRPIALLEKWAFDAVDRLERLGFSMGLVAEDDLGLELEFDGVAVQVQAGGEPAGWPPPPVPPLVTPAKAGEGKWVPATVEWLRRLPGAPHAFYKTALRTDAEHPRSLVVLGALDLRQLDMGMAAGTLTPRTATGIRGHGRFPREPHLINRLVAGFNGGFQTAHGAFGMMADRRVYLPPMPHAATAAVYEDGLVRLGTWNNSIRIPEEIRSFRQNLPPLVADGVWNPTRRRRWGGTISDLDQTNTSRSAMGFVGEQTLLYAWGLSVSAKQLGRVLIAAGAEYAIHLDMNPYHTGMHLLRVEEGTLSERGRFSEFQAKPLSDQMGFEAKRFVNRNSKDFFYFTLRDQLPARLPKPPPGFTAWEGHLSAGFADGFVPRVAVSHGERKGEVLVALDLSGLEAQLRPGAAEPSHLEALGGSGGKPKAVTLKRPLATLDLGTMDPARPLGMVAAGKILWPPRAGLPALTVDPDGRLALLPSIETMDGISDMRQLEPLAQVLEGPLRAHAFGVGPEGVAFYLSRRSGDPSSLGRMLADLGAEQVVPLPSTAGEVSRLHLIGLEDGAAQAMDPVAGKTAPLASLSPGPSRVFLSASKLPPRVRRLRMPDVELSKREARQQKRVMAEISTMREGLRQVANQKYRSYIEKVRTKREERTGLKPWDLKPQ